MYSRNMSLFLHAAGYLASFRYAKPTLEHTGGSCLKIGQQIIETWNIRSLGRSVALRELQVEVEKVGRDKGGAELADGLSCTLLCERGRYRDSTSK